MSGDRRGPRPSSSRRFAGHGGPGQRHACEQPGSRASQHESRPAAPPPPPVVVWHSQYSLSVERTPLHMPSCRLVSDAAPRRTLCFLLACPCRRFSPCSHASGPHAQPARSERPTIEEARVRCPKTSKIPLKDLAGILARASRTRDDGSAGYFLVELGKLCGFHTWPSHRRRTDHHVPGGGRVLESPDMTKRQRRTLQGAIGARGARCAARCELFWRTFPAGEASPSIPSHARSLAPCASLLY